MRLKDTKTVLSLALALAVPITTNALAQPPKPPGGGDPGRARNVEYQGATVLADSTTESGKTYSSDQSAVVARLASGGESTLSDATIVKSGEPEGRSDDYDFFGVNAAVLAHNDAKLELSGGSVETSSSYSSGLFAYGTGTISARDLKIRTISHNSGGLMVTGGGTLTATNLDVETEGGSSAAIRSDRGGGKLTVEGGKYVTNGPGSPAIYSTAEIVVNDAELVSTKSEGAIIEGKNSITLNRTSLTDDNNVLHGKSTTYKNIFIYQSFSGDASIGTSQFAANDCEITTKKGDSIYVTNTACVVKLSGNKFVNEDPDGYFLRVRREGWGRSGSNGGDVALTLDKQDVSGNIYVDNISTLTLEIANGSHCVGAINSANTAKKLEIVLDADSTLELTDDAYVTSVTNADPTGNNIKLNGHKLVVGADPVDDNIPDTTSKNDPFGPPEGGAPGEFGPPEPPQGGAPGEFGPPPRPGNGNPVAGSRPEPPRGRERGRFRPDRRPDGSRGGRRGPR